MTHALEALQDSLGYHFKDLSLLRCALTHRSADRCNNERLEFLGDSVLELVIADYLYKRFPELKEGKLSRLRSCIVCGESLAGIAQTHNLSACVRVGQGELRGGGQNRKSLLADAFEAVVGAVYLDSSLETVAALIRECWFKPVIENLDPNAINKDAKTYLQEWLQARKMSLPEYEVLEVRGEEHNLNFKVSCVTEALDEKVLAEGTSRRKAEQNAASATLSILQASGTDSP